MANPPDPWMNAPASSPPRSLAIRTSFAHHAANSGYRQLLRFTQPVAQVGLDERRGRPPIWPYRSYHWLYEFDAAFLAYRLRVDVVHVLYAENYFRFLKLLCPSIPVVATFHQPPDLLESELRDGSFQGRIAGFTHRLTTGRFAKLAAAIITSEAQRSPLERFVDPARIHHVPLGVDAAEMMRAADEIPTSPNPSSVLTVGNWKRDWNLYFEVVRASQRLHPEWRFTLINRQLPPQWVGVARGLKNLTFLPGVPDAQLFAAYKSASVQFLPLIGAAGNNAVNESLAFGCPVVSNVDLGFGSDASGVVVNASSSVPRLLASIDRFLLASSPERTSVVEQSRQLVLQRDWAVVAAKTIEIYRSVV